MLKNVQVIEKSSGHIVAEYPYVTEPVEDSSEEDYCNEAWENAIEEGIVDEANRNHYDIEIVGDVIPE